MLLAVALSLGGRGENSTKLILIDLHNNYDHNLIANKISDGAVFLSQLFKTAFKN
jgi:hypothetical protein